METQTLLIALIALILGLLIAGFAVAAIFRAKLTAATADSDRLSQEKTALTTERDTLRTEADQLRTANAGLTVTANRAESLANDLEATRADLLAKTNDFVQLETRSIEQEKNLREQIELLKASEDRLKETFQNLSNEALNKSTRELNERADQLLKLLKEQSEQSFEEKNQQIKVTLDPIRERLAELQKFTSDIETKREGAYQSLDTQIKTLFETNHKLFQETTKLSRSLYDPKAAGHIGEFQLERVLELSGLEKNRHYVSQSTQSDGESSQRPDVEIRLTEGRVIIIDSKAPTTHYLNYINTDSETERKHYVKELTKAVKSHIRALGNRNYGNRTDAVDYTLMFIPVERIYSLVEEEDPDILSFAIENRVLLCTATSLLGVVSVINHIWKQEQLSKSALEIRDLAKTLLDGLSTFADHYVGVGKELNSAVEKYNKSAGSLNRNVISRALKMQKLGVDKPAKGIRELAEVPHDVRFEDRILNMAENPIPESALPPLTEDDEIEIIDTQAVPSQPSMLDLAYGDSEETPLP